MKYIIADDADDDALLTRHGQHDLVCRRRQRVTQAIRKLIKSSNIIVLQNNQI